jgi:hypothetical protein
MTGFLYFCTSASALKLIANALGVSADILLSDDIAQIKDKELLKKFEVIQNMGGDTKKWMLNSLTLPFGVIKAKKAYGI